MTPNEYLGHAIDLAFEAGKGTPNAFDLTFGQRDDTALLAAIDIACEHVWAILGKVAGEEGPRPEAFLRLYEHLDEVRATARGERWPR